MLRSTIVLVAVVLFVIVGTRSVVLAVAGDGRIAATPCVEVFDADRCEQIAVYASRTIGGDRDRIVAVDIVPEPTPPSGGVWSKGAATPIRLRITLVDGSTDELAICGGIVTDPDCLPILR